MNHRCCFTLRPSCFCRKGTATPLYDESLFGAAIQRVLALATGFVSSDPTAPLQRGNRCRTSTNVLCAAELSEDETVSWYHTSLARESRNVNTPVFARSASNVALMQTLSRNILDDVSATKRYTSNVTCTVVFLACDIFRRFLRLKFESSSASVYVLSGARSAELELPVETDTTTVRTVVLPLISGNFERGSVNTQVDRLIKVTSNLSLRVSRDDCFPYFHMLQLKHYLTACMWIAHKMSTVNTHDAFNFISSTVRTVTKNKHSADASELVKNERHVLSVTQFEVLLPTACDFIMFFASLFFGDGGESASTEATDVTGEGTKTIGISRGTCERCISPSDVTRQDMHKHRASLSKKRRVSEAIQMSSAARANKKSHLINETPRAIEQRDELFSRLSLVSGALKNTVHKSKAAVEFKVKPASRSNRHQHKHRGTSGSPFNVEGPPCTCVLRVQTSIELIHSFHEQHRAKRKSVTESLIFDTSRPTVANTVIFCDKSIRDSALALLREHYLTLNLGCFRPSEIAFACVISALTAVLVPGEHQEVHWRTVFIFSASVAERLMLDIRNIILVHVKMHKWTVQVD